MRSAGAIEQDFHDALKPNALRSMPYGEGAIYLIH
jgi:hypothetical protein